MVAGEVFSYGKNNFQMTANLRKAAISVIL